MLKLASLRVIRLPEKTLLLLSSALIATGVVFFWVVKDIWLTPAAPRPLTSSNLVESTGSTSEVLRAIFSPSALPRLKAGTNTVNPFFTTYFRPPAPPPPVTTRRIELSYQGYFQTPNGAKQAYVMVGTNLVVGPSGTKLVADLSVADFNLTALTIKRGQTQEIVVPFRVKKEQEVPLP